MRCHLSGELGDQVKWFLSAQNPYDVGECSAPDLAEGFFGVGG